MSLRHRWTIWLALLCTLTVVCTGLQGNAADVDAEKSSGPAASPKEAPIKRAAAGSIGIDKAEKERGRMAEACADGARLEAWRKNIAEWKKWEPGEPADNSFCLVCHANLEDEPLVQVHLPEGVGCETCHGISDKHSEDEDSLIPPDVIFATAKISQFCILCHDQNELIESASEHHDLFTQLAMRHDSPRVSKSIDKKQKTCTNCHDFEHLLKNRTRRWNKETRKIEWYDGVRMMQSRE